MEPERSTTWERLLSLEEKEVIRAHPQLRPKGGKQREYLRLRSQKRLWSDEVRFKEIKPLEEHDLKRLRESQFRVKLVDMGNACYIDKTFSDIIQTR